MSNPGEPDDRATKRARGDRPTGLRGAIDSGKTRDKVDAVDPAAAPLGTDDEAAGGQPEAEVIPLASRRKIGTDPDRTQAGGMEHGGWSAWIVVGVALALALLGILTFSQ